MLSLGLCASLKSAPRTSLFQAKTSVEYTSIKKQGGGVPRFVRENGVGAIHAEYSLHPGVRSGYMVRDRVVLAPSVSTFQKFHYSTSGTKQVVPLPPLTESISSGTVFKVEKPQGSPVSADDVVLVIETEKIQVEVRTPYGGVVESVMVSEGDTVEVGQDLFVVMEGASAPPPQSAQEGQKPAQNAEEQKPVQSAQDVQKPAQKAEVQKPVQDLSNKGTKGESSPQPSPRPLESPADRTDTRVRMTQARKRTAIRLKESQNTAAMLTTFNEVDMQALTDFRNSYKDRFQEKYGVKLGFMSAFVKASAVALTEIPIVNATMDGEEIVYHNYVDISVAVSTPTSLVVPVLRNVQSMSFDQIEFAINQYAKKARDNKLTIDDMSGGTFTISNGGVFGSLMGTPIINPPQSAILGMHAINKRPSVVRDQILIRPMMYLALTYDHRLIDGRDAVTFLKRIKTLIEDPASLLLGV